MGLVVSELPTHAKAMNGFYASPYKKTDSLKKVLSAYQTKNLNKKPH